MTLVAYDGAMKRTLTTLALLVGLLPLVACDAMDSAACDVKARAAADAVRGIIESELGSTLDAAPEFTCDGGGVSLMFDRTGTSELVIRAKLVEMGCEPVNEETFGCETAGQAYDVAVFGEKWLQVVIKDL